MRMDEKDYLAHYGILRRSGRYPWGSGGTQNTRNKMFLDHVADLRSQGLNDTEIARGFGISRTQLQAAKSIAKNQQKQELHNRAQRLADKGMSYSAIGRQMSLNESSVRALLAPGQKDKLAVLDATTNMLRDHVDNKKFVDIGAGTEYQLGISKNKLAQAVAKLHEEGYVTQKVKIEQVGTGKFTEFKVLCRPGTTQKDAWMNRNKIQQITSFSDDGGRSFLGIHPPIHVDSSRIAIKYREQGGHKEDGVMYIRPGVPDLLMAKRYGQVRIAVDGSHFLKGMAIYKEDLPKGVDILFNTNKSDTGNKHDAMKPLKDDPENPFGSIVRQRIERDAHGKERVTSALNMVGSPSKEGSGEEGSWDTWSRTLSSQFLSKQNRQLAKDQLEMTYQNRKADLDEILQLTNAGVRKKLLEDYADKVDAAAVHLKAAHLPRQSTRVILPLPSLKETEVYAPSFKPGERVVLVRHPHGGPFEIPELIVNNRHPEGKKLLGDAEDAIGIHPKTAEKLSGADFDGDTVLVIPNNHGKIKTAATLEGLKNFDPKHSYPEYPGMTVMTPHRTQVEMGRISNLITDMTIKGASTTELARAVRHSMVVIDAEKHRLDFKSSEVDNGIPALKEKYQGGKRAGAATLISKKGHEINVPERKQSYRIDPVTGKKTYLETGALVRDRKTGELVPKTQKAPQILEVSDAHKMSSGMPVEKVYADHANKLKDLGNTARRELVNTKGIQRSPSATKAYSKEVESLDSKLHIALRNAPLERQAQVIANTTVAAKLRAEPDMEKDEKKKIKSLALSEARTRTGAKKTQVEITTDEWDAIQAGAISQHKLDQIMKNTDNDKLKELAMPKTKLLMTSTKTSRAKAMLANGYTQSEVADALGVSLTTLKTAIGG